MQNILLATTVTILNTRFLEVMYGITANLGPSQILQILLHFSHLPMHGNYYLVHGTLSLSLLIHMCTHTHKHTHTYIPIKFLLA
jgi:hypothetical protein